MKISKKKPFIPINQTLREYLIKYDRSQKLPIAYKDLLGYHESYPLYDKFGNSTLWDTLMYHDIEISDLKQQPTMLYSLLNTEGDMQIIQHLQT